MPDELLHRIHVLEGAVRRWKTIALGLALVLALVLILGGGLGFTLALGTMQVRQARELAEMERMRALQARDEAERAMQQAEEARRLAEIAKQPLPPPAKDNP